MSLPVPFHAPSFNSGETVLGSPMADNSTSNGARRLMMYHQPSPSHGGAGVAAAAAAAAQLSGTNIHIRAPTSSSPFSSSINFHSSLTQLPRPTATTTITPPGSASTSKLASPPSFLESPNYSFGPNTSSFSSSSSTNSPAQHVRTPSASTTATLTPSTTMTTLTSSSAATTTTGSSSAKSSLPKIQTRTITHVTSASSGSNSPSIMTAAPTPAPSFVSNKPASSAGSLYQKCALLKARLETVPGLEFYVQNCYKPDARHSAGSTTSSQQDLGGSVSALSTPPNSGKMDPVSFVWRFLRQGSSLCALFNVLEPNTLLKTEYSDDLKQSKRAVYDFVQGCKAELSYSDSELFTISNVFSDNTSDLLKVMHTVELLLDALETRGLITPSARTGVQDHEPKDKRDKVVQELLLTERKFVQDMEVLYDYQHELQKSGILSVDTIHALFPNLNLLVDFQRRFLVGVEYNATLPAQEQRFGSLFETMEEGIEVYKGYSLNQQNACDIASQEVIKLQALSHLIEPSYELPSLLIKPIQRICKYPLLLKEMIKYTPEDWPYYPELLDGLEAIKRITSNVNESQRKVENGIVLKELQQRLRDWRGHNVNDFGELLHEGVFPVVKTGFEREYHLYLFENIILCCKEAGQNKKGMTALGGRKAKTQSGGLDKSKRSSLVLKGRIYMAYITNVSISKRDGYFLHISWGKDDASDTGFFDIRFRHEELLNQWESTIRTMVARYQESANEMLMRSQFEDPNMINGTTYEDGSEDEYVSDFAASREYGQSNNNNNNHNYGSQQHAPVLPHSHIMMEPFDPAQFSPASETNSMTTPTGRTISTSSTQSSTYPFPYQQQIGIVTEDLHAFKIQEGSREGSQVSLSAANRSRSASTPSFNNAPSAPPNGAGGAVNAQNGRYQLPHLHSHSGAHPPQLHPTDYSAKAARIKSESAAVDRLAYSSSHDSASSAASSATSTGGRSVSTATTAATIYASPATSASAAPKIKVKLHFLEDTFLIMVPETINYLQLLERIERKIRLCGKQTPSPLRIKYKDEDDDFVSINSDEDIQMALEPTFENDILTIWVA